MKNRAVLFCLLAVASAVVVDIARYAREQGARADGWREEYFDLLDWVDKCATDVGDRGSAA